MTANTKVKNLTLVFIINEDTGEVLLGCRKGRFGRGYWDGFGGKVEKSETILQGAIREVKEECGLDIELDDSLATIDYSFVKNPSEIQRSFIYRTTKYSGTLQETREMRPKWWPIKSLPYNKMWEDSPTWYELMYENTAFKAAFQCDGRNQIVKGYLQMY